MNILTDMQDKNSSSAATRLRHNSPTTEKSLKTSNYVQQVTSFQPPIPCPQHYHDNICYICIDCKYKCLCGTCLQEGSHKSHHVKNIEKGSKIIDRVLNESLIRLRSKSDLLTNLKDYMKIRKSEIFHQYNDYEQTFNSNFDNLALAVAEKKREMIQLIQNYHQSISQKMDILIQQINQQSVLTLEMISTVEDKIDKFKQYPTSLCLFFQDKNVIIENMVDLATAKFQSLKRKEPDVKWMVEMDIFDNLRSQINSLAFVTKDQSVELSCSSYQNKKPIAKKLDSKLDKVKSSNILGCRTPKNIQQGKIHTNNFKSPSNIISRKSKGKLNSMPVSPSKEKTPKKKSPIRLKMEEAGKKFKKTKK